MHIRRQAETWPEVLRGTPLTTEEKKELTIILKKLNLTVKSSGQVTIHISEGSVTAVNPSFMLR